MANIIAVPNNLTPYERDFIYDFLAMKKEEREYMIAVLRSKRIKCMRQVYSRELERTEYDDRRVNKLAENFAKQHYPSQSAYPTTSDMKCLRDALLSKEWNTFYSQKIRDKLALLEDEAEEAEEEEDQKRSRFDLRMDTDFSSRRIVWFSRRSGDTM